MFLYIIRHGDPDYDKDCLTERGKKQAEALSKRLAESGITKVFSSPMGRAKETAEPTCRRLGIEYQVVDWMHEISEYVRAWNPDGTLKYHISLLPAASMRESGAEDLGFYGCLDAFPMKETRMKEAMEKISANSRIFLAGLGYEKQENVYKIVAPNDERVAVFCHTGFGRAWISELLHIPLNIMWCSNYTHTGVTVLEFENSETGFTAPKLLCYSDMSHLYAAGLDMIYNGKFKI